MTCSSSAQSTSGSMPAKWKPDPTDRTAIWMRGDDCRTLISSCPDFPSFCINKVNSTPFPWAQQPWPWLRPAMSLVLCCMVSPCTLLSSDQLMFRQPANGLRQLRHSFLFFSLLLFPRQLPSSASLFISPGPWIRWLSLQITKLQLNSLNKCQFASLDINCCHKQKKCTQVKQD